MHIIYGVDRQYDKEKICQVYNAILSVRYALNVFKKASPGAPESGTGLLKRAAFPFITNCFNCIMFLQELSLPVSAAGEDLEPLVEGDLGWGEDGTFQPWCCSHKTKSMGKLVFYDVEASPKPESRKGFLMSAVTPSSWYVSPPKRVNEYGQTRRKYTVD